MSVRDRKRDEIETGKQLVRWRVEELIRRAAEDLGDGHVAIGVVEMVLEKIAEQEGLR